MEKIAFRMFLKAGHAAEYKHRHDAIWPELVALLRESGISDYSIYLDEETHVLFAVLQRTDPPVHNRYRKLLNRVFTARKVASMAAHIDDVTNTLIDR